MCQVIVSAMVQSQAWQVSTEHTGFEHFNNMSMESLKEKTASNRRHKEDTGQTKYIAVFSNNKESVATETEWGNDSRGGEKFKETLESPYDVESISSGFYNNWNENDLESLCKRES